MVLAEVLIEKKYIKKRIKQLKKVLEEIITENTELADKATKKLIDLFDRYRSHLILINKINNSVVVNIGGSKVSLVNTVLIVKTIKKKIDLLDDLISSKGSVLDVFNLIDQRDKLLVEYITISNELKAIEWRTEVD